MAQSKRDLIWEEKRRQREERLQRMEGQYDDLIPSYQQPVSIPSQQLKPAYELQPFEPPVLPYQVPSQQIQRNYSPVQKSYSPPPQQQLPSYDKQQQPQQQPQQSQQPQQPPQQQPPQAPLQYKQQQQEYRDYLKMQMEQKEQDKKQNKNTISNNNAQQQQQQQQQQQYSQPPPPPQQQIPPQKNAKQEYADYLRQQMQEKEQQKQQRPRVQSGAPDQQDVYSRKQQKHEYGDFLREQMQLKQQKQISKKDELAMKFEQEDSFPFGKAGNGAPNRPKQPQNNTYEVYNNEQQQQQYQPPPPQYQSYQQQPQQYQYSQPPQQQQYAQPPSQQQYQQAPQSQQQFQQLQQPLPMYDIPLYDQQQQQPYQAFQQQPQQQVYQPQPPPQYDMPQQDIPQKGGRNRLMMENANQDDLQRKEKQKLEMQRVLQEQIEEKKRKKEQEKLQQELEDRQEEERVRKELAQQELEAKKELDQKKQKQEVVKQDNVDIKEQRRLQRLQDRKGRAPVEAPEQPSSPPRSENNYLKEFLQNEKLKEGMNPDQSIVDFYKNGHRVEQHQIQQNKDIEDLKKQMQQQQEFLQQQLNTVMNQAHNAIESRNKAENELMSLKDQVKNKYLQDEQQHKDLMVALVRNDPKWEKQVFPPHLLAQAEISEYRNLAMPEIRDTPQQPVYQSKPLAFHEESKQKKQQFNEQYGLQSLVSDSNMVPIDGAGQMLPPRQPARGLPQIDELNQHMEDTYKEARPQSQPNWNIPSINSDINREIDELLNYRPNQRPPSNMRRQPLAAQAPPANNRRPPSSTFGQAAKGILNSNDSYTGGGDTYQLGGSYGGNNYNQSGGNYQNQYKQGETYKMETSKHNNMDNHKGFTLDSEFPDMSVRRGVDTFDIGNVNKQMDEKLMRLNEIDENDEDMRKLNGLLKLYQ